MKPPGSISRRPTLTGCSLPGASCGPGRCPAGPVPARAPPCRLLLVLLLLPALATSSRPRARGAAAPSGGYGRCPLRCLPRGALGRREKGTQVRVTRTSGSPAWPSSASLSTSPPLSVPSPGSCWFTFGSPFLLHSLKTHSSDCGFHPEVFGGS